MNSNVHKFDNGIKVYDYQLLDLQKERYASHNIHEAEEEGVFLDSITNIRAGGTYVNVGAAIGYYPMLAASIRKDLKIIAYEPLKVHRAYFYENIKLNGFIKADFEIHGEGVYVKNGVFDFSIKNYSSMIKEENKKKGTLRSIIEKFSNKRIDCITLDQLCDRENSNIDFLQMDIQGLEADVLESTKTALLEHRIKRLLVGTHSVDIHRRCKKSLEKHGYQILMDIHDTKLQPDGILLMEYDLQ